MRFLVFISFVFFNAVLIAQQRFKEMRHGDSVVIYQCHVETAEQRVYTVSGQTLNTAPEKISITEKFVLIKDSLLFRMKYYTSSMIILPNRKFSGLKIREKAYWNFKFQKDTTITFSALAPFIEIEKKGRETTEYDFAVSKHTTNQIIIKSGKKFRQLVVEEDLVLSRKFFPGLL